MAIKKSELYSSLWASCDELRGSMDASQYKDYVLVLLFMKYVSDKGGALVEIPKGGSFKDMVKLKGQADIGDKINKIIGELAKANDLTGVITVADFNDDEKLGKGKDKVDRLSNLIEIFEKPELDFSSNRAEGDDILGDAGDGVSAIEKTKKLLPDVVILDISIPKINGIETAKQIRSIDPDIKIIVLTMYEAKELITRMLDIGVSAYLNKESTDTDLVAAIETTMNGQVFFSPSVSKVMVEKITNKKNDISIPEVNKESYNKLTGREKTILYMVAEGYCSKEIAKYFSISINTVNNHRASIMKKLNIHDAVGLTKYAINVGLLVNVKQKKSIESFLI